MVSLDLTAQPLLEGVLFALGHKPDLLMPRSARRARLEA